MQLRALLTGDRRWKGLVRREVTERKRERQVVGPPASRRSQTQVLQVCSRLTSPDGNDVANEKTFSSKW